MPSVHDQIINNDSAYFKACQDLRTEYILAFNIGAVWNIIVMWPEHDMTESPEEIKETIVAYLKNMIRFL